MIKAIFFPVITFLMLGCAGVECDSLKKDVQSKYINLVIQESNSLGRGILLKGYTPVDEKAVQFEEDQLFYRDILKNIVKGDTLFKPIESLTYTIKKAHKNISIEYTCDKTTVINELEKPSSTK